MGAAPGMSMDSAEQGSWGFPGSLEAVSIWMRRAPISSISSPDLGVVGTELAVVGNLVDVVTGQGLTNTELADPVVEIAVARLEIVGIF